MESHGHREADRHGYGSNYGGVDGGPDVGEDREG